MSLRFDTLKIPAMQATLKNIIFAFIWVLALNSTHELKCQIYKPILFGKNSFQTFIPRGYCDGISTDTLKFVGDTIIQNRHYSIMTAIDEWRNDTLAFYRQDSSFSKLWLWSRNKEHLVYDLSLKVNDSFEITHLNDKSFFIKVVKVDTQNSKKHIYFDTEFGICLCCDTELFQFIEGHGSNGGLMYYLFLHTFPNTRVIQESYLLCEDSLGVSIYKNKLIHGECYVREVNTNNQSHNNQYYLYPNPTHDEIRFQSLDNAIDLNGHITLFNITGQVLYETNINGKKNITLKVSDYFQSHGFLKYTSKSGTYVYKIIVQ